MSEILWITKAWPFALDEAYGVADDIGDRCLSASVILFKEGETKQWGLEIISDTPMNRDVDKAFLSVDHFSCEQLPDVNWLERCFENFKPITIGNFYIYGSHSKLTVNQKNKICMQIDAASAFGSGEHQTTEGCLRALYTYFNPKKHRSVMDLGCGSSILSIALAKLGCKNVFAYDNDPGAIRVSERNLVINHVNESVKLKRNLSDEFKIRKYDMIVSNILALPLIYLANSIVECLNKDGTLIISGFTDQQLDVVSHYKGLGLREVKSFNIDSWMTVVLQKI